LRLLPNKLPLELGYSDFFVRPQLE